MSHFLETRVAGTVSGQNLEMTCSLRSPAIGLAVGHKGPFDSGLWAGQGLLPKKRKAENCPGNSRRRGGAEKGALPLPGLCTRHHPDPSPQEAL